MGAAPAEEEAKDGSLSLQHFIEVLRARWITVCAATLAGVIIAAGVSVLTEPVYEASTRLFVSTSNRASVSELYEGNRLSQDRVLSYMELAKGHTLAQRTIDKLGLEITAGELAQNVQASAKPDTVLITVKVRDSSPLRARDIANTLSDEFVALVGELETPEGGGQPDARVVVEQRASIPVAPILPKTSLNIAIGIVVGLVAGIGLAVLRDQLDNTIKDREDLEQATGLSLVGSIPMDKERRKQPAINFAEDNSPIAEAFRKARTNLQFLAVDKPPRVIVFTSALPAEGKSTTTINTALAIAEAGHSVVIVDGDMRKPTISKYLDVVGTVGFSTVLSGASSLEEALQETRFPGLSVLASGAIPPNPSELLGSQAARKVLDDLRFKFDYVIIDSAPVLAVADASILANAADGVILIAKFGQSKREHLAQSAANLRDVGASILGAVFTMTPTRGAQSYHYKYANYGGQESRS